MNVKSYPTSDIWIDIETFIDHVTKGVCKAETSFQTEALSVLKNEMIMVAILHLRFKVMGGVGKSEAESHLMLS